MEFKTGKLMWSRNEQWQKHPPHGSQFPVYGRGSAILADGKLIHFHTVVPLYTEERDYEAKFGLREFYQRFIQRKVSITVDIHRPSFVD